MHAYALVTARGRTMIMRVLHNCTTAQKRTDRSVQTEEKRTDLSRECTCDILGTLEDFFEVHLDTHPHASNRFISIRHAGTITYTRTRTRTYETDSLASHMQERWPYHSPKPLYQQMEQRR